MEIKLEDIIRLEVIDENGRSYTNWDKANKVELSLQDDGKTLKIFISKDQKLKRDRSINQLLDEN